METSRQEKSMRYLLGKLSGQEVAEFEAQCFEDDDLFHEVTGLENDLIHSYLRGELSNVERGEFEKGYLISPARHRKVEFAQALEQRLFGSNELQGPSKEQQFPSARPVPGYLAFPSRAMRFVSIAAAAVAVTIIAWLAIIDRGLSTELGQMKTRQAELHRAQQELEAKLAAVTSRLQEKEQLPGFRGPDMIAFNLTPGLSRNGGAVKQLMIPPGIISIGLNLYLEEDKYPAYRASLETLAGKSVWRKAGLKARADSKGHQIISLSVPSDTLKNGDYVVKLDGITKSGEVEENIAAYRFAIARGAGPK
jgi:hypothetical protein